MFANNGNECFINCVLSSLMFCPFMANHYFLTPQTGLWADAYGEAWGKARGLKALKKKVRSGPGVLSKQGQQDAHEAYIEIADLLPEELKEMLIGQCSVSVTCESCGHIVRAGTHPYKSRLFPPEELTEPLPDYTCESCGATGYCQREETLTKPPVRVYHIHRSLGGTRKDNTPKNYPLEDLFAVVRHWGKSMGSGHYTATARYHNKWFDLDDDIMTETQEPRPDGTEYMIFYRFSSTKAIIAE